MRRRMVAGNTPLDLNGALVYAGIMRRRSIGHEPMAKVGGLFQAAIRTSSNLQRRQAIPTSATGCQRKAEGRMNERFQQAFQEEARELLRELEAALLELDQNRADLEIVGRAFGHCTRSKDRAQCSVSTNWLASLTIWKRFLTG